jgi:hypothetical protein
MRKFPLFISIDGDDQRTLLLATAMHQAAGVQVITRRCVLLGTAVVSSTSCSSNSISSSVASAFRSRTSGLLAATLA